MKYSENYTKVKYTNSGYPSLINGDGRNFHKVPIIGEEVSEISNSNCEYS